jgi:hypothetical protein
MAWLLTAPAAGVSLAQDNPAANSPQSPSSAPADTSQSARAKGQPPAVDQAASETAAKRNTQSKPADRSAKRHRQRKRNTDDPTPAAEPRKIVVREGGAIEPPARIVPGLAPQEAGQQRQHAVELLSSTEENLKRLAARTLDSRQQETVAQIHNYVDGARSALKDGDTQRAHTLALKAHLLADDLVKH